MECTTTNTYREAREWMYSEFDHIDLNLILESNDYPDAWSFFGLDEYGELARVGPPIRYTVYHPRQLSDALYYMHNCEHIIKELGFGIVFRGREFFGLTIDGVGFDTTPYFQKLFEFRYQHRY